VRLDVSIFYGLSRAVTGTDLPLRISVKPVNRLFAEREEHADCEKELIGRWK
jgi:hypothetical protein